MPIVERKDNIGDTTSSTGTGTINLAAVAQAGSRIFAGNVTSGATVRYDIRNADESEWEIGEGVFTDGSPDTLSRVTVYASSNAGSLVDFSAGTKNVSMVLTAADLAKATGAEINTGTDDDKKVTSKAIADSYLANEYYGMARQAIMNGNFDIWQRGTSVALADVTAQFQADRWYDVQDKNGGTLPTLTRSQQLLTSGDIAGSKYFSRLATNGAGTSLGVNSYGVYVEKIENGTSKLCGASKKVTISFYARSSITNKRITPTLDQNYGTGGSPTAVEYILGTPITLTSTWTKYTVTFTTNTLVGKTFGTNGDDYLGLVFWNMWGSTIGNTRVQASVSAETYIGSGNIDIAQVQLCSGDVALPFQPKSYVEELALCQRYCLDLTGGNAQANITLGIANPISTTHAWIEREFPVNMRVAPTLETLTASNFSFGYPGAVALTAFIVQLATSRSILFDGSTASGLTANTIVHLYRPGTTATIILNAEL